MKTHNNQKPSHDYRIGIGQLDTPGGLMIHRCIGSGAEYHLYVADFNNHRIQIFNPVDGSYIRSIGQGRGAGPGQLNGPVSIAALLGPEGGISELYVSDKENHRVSVFDMATGAFQRHIGAGRGANAGQMSYPQGIALSLRGVASQGGDDLLYVSDFGNDRIQIFNTRTGGHVGYLGVGELRRPCGMKIHKATDNRSLLFVTDFGNKRIQVFEV
jgi:DNA-binding beta-propeller fold protein YncE